MKTTTPTRDDLDRAEFLKALDEAGFEVTDWEARFIEANLFRSIFSDAQRIKIDQMRKEYGHRL